MLNVRKPMRKIPILILLFVAATALQVVAQTSSSQKPYAQDSAKKEEEVFPNIKKLSFHEIDGFLDKFPNAVILDVRKPEEAAQAGTFKGAINIPIDQLEQRLSEIPKDRFILPFSNHAARASKAADLLEKHGYKIAGAAGVQTYATDGGTKYLVLPVSARK